MTQSVVIQVGQCGNQIGCRFWDLATREHTYVQQSTDINCEASLESFFRPLDSKKQCLLQGTFGMKARAVLVDMEEGVISGILKGPLGDVFDSRQLVTDVSGSGNNWAVGHKQYGTCYKEKITELLRKEAECCDCLQCFFLLHSTGGGTGSGLGTAILELLCDEFPEVHRFVTAVYPSIDDDVITSPYNTLLATHYLTEFADCVFPVENQALLDICNQVARALPPGQGLSRMSPAFAKPESAVTSSTGGLTKPRQKKPFDQMNNIVANLLLNMTSSSRFMGSLNVDLNEIVMNLVPFPYLHYLQSSLTPLYALSDMNIPCRRLDQMFTDAFSPRHHLIQAEVRSGVNLACALLVRGKVHLSDIRRNIDRLRSGLKFVSWNKDGWKTGLCTVPPVGHPYSLLTLSNNTCLQKPFVQYKERFIKMYRKKAHLHHFLHVEGMDKELFDASLSSLTSLIDEYRALESTVGVDSVLPRIQIAI